PHRGWECLGVRDLNPDELPSEEVEYGTCEACGQHPIRFVHTLGHDDWEGAIEVGCICSARLTEDDITPYRRERELRHEAARRQREAGRAAARRARREARRASLRERWDSMEWRISARGDAWVKPDGVLVVVFPVRGGFRYMAGGHFSDATFADEDDAKLVS